MITLQAEDEVPLKVEDLFSMRLKMTKNLVKELQATCFSNCAQRWEVPMLTYDEGLCVRNCYTKFGNWFPTLAPNVQGTYLEELNAQLEAKTARK